MEEIAIIGTGNVGGALAQKLSEAGHFIHLGVRDKEHFKGKDVLFQHPNVTVHTIAEAVAKSQIVILAVPASAAGEVAKQLGDVSEKILIDTMNMVGPKTHAFDSVSHLIAAHCNCKKIVKCFNSTGYENILNLIYQNKGIDMYVASDSTEAIQVATRLAHDIGFGQVHVFGGLDKTALLEQFALCWINLAIFQNYGRDVAFTLTRRTG